MNVWVVILPERAVAWGRRTRAGPPQIRMSVLRRAPPWRAGAIEPAPRMEGQACPRTCPSSAPHRTGSPRWLAGSAGEGLGAETAPRDEAGQGEQDQGYHDSLGLATADVRDERADHQQHQTDGGQRHQN